VCRSCSCVSKRLLRESAWLALPRCPLARMPGFFVLWGSGQRAAGSINEFGKWISGSFRGQKKALLPWSGEQGFLRKLGLRGPNEVPKHPARYISLLGDSNLVLDRRP
jgi:hypothetical protein